jgi:hypothetical protein
MLVLLVDIGLYWFMLVYADFIALRWFCYFLLVLLVHVGFAGFCWFSLKSIVSLMRPQISIVLCLIHMLQVSLFVLLTILCF